METVARINKILAPDEPGRLEGAIVIRGRGSEKARLRVEVKLSPTRRERRRPVRATNDRSRNAARADDRHLACAKI